MRLPLDLDTLQQHMPPCRVRVCARGCASAYVGVVACVVCSVLVLGNMGFPSTASMSGSLLLVAV
jgi:hypothetical protein